MIEVSFAELRERFLAMPEKERLQLLLNHQNEMRHCGDPLLEKAVIERAQKLGLPAKLLKDSGLQARLWRQQQQLKAVKQVDHLAELEAVATNARRMRERQPAEIERKLSLAERMDRAGARLERAA